MRLNIKDKLEEKGLNKHQFSQLIQLGYASTCNLYDGKTERIYFDTLEKICIVLECTPNDIIVTDNPQLKRIMAYHDKLNNNNNKSDTE